jgi:hypothetical protein
MGIFAGQDQATPPPPPPIPPAANPPTVASGAVAGANAAAQARARAANGGQGFNGTDLTSPGIVGAPPTAQTALTGVK